MSNETVTIPSAMWKNALVKIDELKAQNERLRKAGNAIALLHMPDDHSPEKVKYECLLDWANALEGGDIK